MATGRCATPSVDGGCGDPRAEGCRGAAGVQDDAGDEFFQQLPGGAGVSGQGSAGCGHAGQPGGQAGVQQHDLGAGHDALGQVRRPRG